MMERFTHRRMIEQGDDVNTVGAPALNELDVERNVVWDGRYDVPVCQVIADPEVAPLMCRFISNSLNRKCTDGTETINEICGKDAASDRA